MKTTTLKQSVKTEPVSVFGETLKNGDGAAIENAEALEIQSREGAQFLLFDLK